MQIQEEIEVKKQTWTNPFSKEIFSDATEIAYNKSVLEEEILENLLLGSFSDDGNYSINKDILIELVSVNKYIEEVGAMNIFFKIKGKIITPILNGSILAGVTRNSVIKVCKDFGYDVDERRVSVEELYESAKDGTLEEVFGAGTAAVIAPVGALKFGEEVFDINDGKTGEFSQKIYDTITGIQTGKIEDKFNWIIEV